VVVGEWSESAGRNVWLIDSGLAAGDRVIVEGVARIMLPNSPVRLTDPAPAAPPAAAGKP
jgi:membrane fusion protein (multidrug efflux system)